MDMFDNKKRALEFLDFLKAGYNEVGIDVIYNENLSLDELNAVIELSFKKMAKFVMKKKGINYDKGGVQ